MHKINVMPYLVWIVTGISHSSAPFSQFGEGEGEEEEVETVFTFTEDTTATTNHAPPTGTHKAVTARKRITSKKPKTKKQSFEDCLAEVRPH